MDSSQERWKSAASAVDFSKFSDEALGYKATSNSLWLDHVSQGDLIALSIILAFIFLFFKKPWRWKLHNTHEFHILFSISIVWATSVNLWGFIWHWESEFDIPEFIALNIAIPIILGITLLMKSWVNKSK